MVPALGAKHTCFGYVAGVKMFQTLPVTRFPRGPQWAVTVIIAVHVR